MKAVPNLYLYKIAQGTHHSRCLFIRLPIHVGRRTSFEKEGQWALRLELRKKRFSKLISAQIVTKNNKSLQDIKLSIDR